MSDLSFHSDSSFNRYLFEYRHGDSEWGIEIMARTPQEAQERIQALTWARYKGEVHTSFRIPTSGTIVDRIRRLLSWRS